MKLMFFTSIFVFAQLIKISRGK